MIFIHFSFVQCANLGQLRSITNSTKILTEVESVVPEYSENC